MCTTSPVAFLSIRTQACRRTNARRCAAFLQHQVFPGRGVLHRKRYIRGTGNSSRPHASSRTARSRSTTPAAPSRPPPWPHAEDGKGADGQQRLTVPNVAASVGTVAGVADFRTVKGVFESEEYRDGSDRTRVRVTVGAENTLTILEPVAERYGLEPGGGSSSWIAACDEFTVRVLPRSYAGQLGVCFDRRPGEHRVRSART